MKAFFSFLNQFDSKNYIIFIFLALINSIIEILGLSLMFPLFEILLGDSDSKILNYLKQNDFLFNSNNEYIFIFILVLIAGVYIFKFFVSMLIVYFSNLIKQNIKIEVQKKILKNFFKRSYLSHGKDNIPTQIRMVTSEAESALIVVEAFFMLTVEVMILGFICFFLFINFFEISLIMSIVMSGVLFIYLAAFNKRLKKLGSKRIEEENNIHINIFNSLNIFREIKFMNKENFFLEKIFINLKKLKSITIINTLINRLSRSFLELFVVIIILLTLYYSKIILAMENTAIISSLGIFLAAIIRAFPSITKLIVYHQTLTFGNRSTKIISEIFNENENVVIEKSSSTNFELNSEIKIKDLEFKYDGRNILFNNVNLNINSKECIGFVGKNGSGKSTLLDLITGVIQPDKGEILVDKKNIKENLKNWQKKIIFLSQKNFFFESSILLNITLGENIDNVDKEKFLNCLKITNLNDTIELLPNKEETIIKSNNSNLSGGQQKKIQIARAFYQLNDEKKLIICDEPFENLDIESKEKFLDYLNKLKSKFTIILISHNKNDLKFCDKLFDVNNI